MSLRHVVAFVLSAALFGAIAACGSPTPACSATTCPDGCCDAAGTCHAGTADATCGSKGGACVDCSATGQLCGSDTACHAAPVDSGIPDAGGASDGGYTSVCPRTPLECADQAIQELGLLGAGTVATGLVSNEADGGVFVSTVDSRAGGTSPTQSFLYARFTDQGLVKLSLDDTAALDSMDWDIAFRRFVIRINSGDSGPSCVGAEVQGQGFDAISAVPAVFVPGEDDFLARSTCTFIPDSSGLGTSPNTYLSTFYAYTSCVTMTGKAYVLKVNSGRHVKLTVTTYYSTDAQQQACNASGTMGTGGTVRVKWAFLD